MSAAIVTGGSAGIGRAVVQKLLEKNYDVISLDLQPSLAEVKLGDVDALVNLHLSAALLPACSAWRAPGRSSSRRRASRSTWSLRGRSRPTIFTASCRAAARRRSASRRRSL